MNRNLGAPIVTALGLLATLVLGQQPAAATDPPCSGDDIVVETSLDYQEQHVDIYDDHIYIRWYKENVKVGSWGFRTRGTIDEILIESNPGTITYFTIVEARGIGLICGGDGQEWIVVGPDALPTQPALFVRGGGERDQISGSLESDRIEGGPGDDKIYGLGGDDLLSGDDGDDLIVGHEGEDGLDGGPGDDLLSGDGIPATVILGAGIGVPWGPAEVDELDKLDGGPGSDWCGSAIADAPVIPADAISASCEYSFNS